MEAESFPFRGFIVYNSEKKENLLLPLWARNYNASLKTYVKYFKICQHAILNAKQTAWIDVVFVVKDIIVIFRKIKSILISISFKCYFRILKNQYLT